MSEQDQQPTGDSQPRRPLTQRIYNTVIDQQYAQAEAEGQFTNLQGHGKPLDLNDDAHVPEEDRAGYRMLRGSGLTLPWVEARKDIDEERRRIDGWLVHANDRWLHLDEPGREKTRAEFRKKLEGLRSMILDYNLRVPPSVGQMRGVEMSKELARLGIE